MNAQRAFDLAQQGERARVLVVTGLAEFQGSCAVHDWEASEKARAKAHDALDAYFDSVAMLHRG